MLKEVRKPEGKDSFSKFITTIIFFFWHTSSLPPQHSPSLQHAGAEATVKANGWNS